LEIADYEEGGDLKRILPRYMGFVRMTQFIKKMVNEHCCIKCPQNLQEKLCYKCILLLPVEFITKYFKELFDP
jgi:hypothetical protein